MQLVPVIDLYRGRVVHAVAGQRERYQPLTTTLVDSPTIASLSHIIGDSLHGTAIYGADLDAIVNGKRIAEEWRMVTERGLSLWLDGGFRDAGPIRDARQAGYEPVLGTECWSRPDSWRSLLSGIQKECVWISVDLRAGYLQINGRNASDRSFSPDDAVALLTPLFHAGCRRWILLDLADVGGNAGCSTLGLARRLRTVFGSELQELAVGGGIRSPEDIAAAEASGATKALIGSALHRGVFSSLEWPAS